MVTPGPGYRALCREIIERLEELVNPATGRRVVRKVWLRDDVFAGPAQEHLPDLIVTWEGSKPIAAISSSAIGIIERPSPDPRTGTHSPSAFLLAGGTGFRAGSRGKGRLVDVAATVLELLRVPPDPGMDGRPLERR